MKVLLVTEDLPVANLGGAGKHAVLLGNTLRAAGHEVELLGRRRAAGVVGDNNFEGPLHAMIDLRGTGWQEYRFGAFLPLRREHAAQRIWAAIRQLGTQRYDVIHYHGHVTALGAVVPAGVPFVQTLHDQGSECLVMTRFRQGKPCTSRDPAACAACATPEPAAWQRWLSAAAVRRHRRVAAVALSRHPTIFVSDFLRRRFVENAAPDVPPRAHVIHNFTQARLLAGRPSAEPRAAALLPTALLVGRIDAAKGFAEFLAALPDDALAHWRVRVVGDGPLRAALQERHAARGVEFTGLLTQAETYRETAAATVCVVPSLCEEACSTTVLEALAVGKPTLALARGGTPELLGYARWPGQLMLEADMPALVRRLLVQDWEMPDPARWRPAGADIHDRLVDILPLYADVSQRARASGPG